MNCVGPELKIWISLDSRCRFLVCVCSNPSKRLSTCHWGLRSNVVGSSESIIRRRFFNFSDFGDRPRFPEIGCTLKPRGVSVKGVSIKPNWGRGGDIGDTLNSPFDVRIFKRFIFFAFGCCSAIGVSMHSGDSSRFFLSRLLFDVDWAEIDAWLVDGC